MPKVALLYLVWSDEPKKYLTEALVGIIKQTYAKADTELLIVYNSHKPEEESSLDYIVEEVEKNKHLLPHTTILPQESNLGFTGGNNAGIDWALAHDFNYVFLHNADGYLAPDAITKLVDVMESDRQIGQAQSMVLLHPEHNLINSSGNKWHYLGIGFCDDYRKEFKPGNYPRVKNIGYVSGAATLLRMDLLKRFGGLNPNFYLYHEDTEYSWRLKIQGYRTVLVSQAIFFHKYEFTKNLKKYYWMERNRQAVKLLLYKWPTLLLLLPLEIVYHLGLMVVAWRAGWLEELIKVYRYWLEPEKRKIWLAERKKYQAMRMLTDRQILNAAVARVDSGDLVVSKKITRMANAVFAVYYNFLKMVVRW